MAKPRKRDNAEYSSATAHTDGANTQPTASQHPDRIAMRAYELYLARGGSDGQAWDDWLAAEREISEAEGGRHE